MADKISKEFVEIGVKNKNIQNIDELDFTELQTMGRGQTPEGIEQKCLDLCKDYLGGNWSQQNVDSIQVKRITGGLINQLYHCSIREPNERESIPQEVCIKLLGENMFDPDKSRVKEMVISLIFSENNLGPKVYGVFKGGVIQNFYKHRIFTGTDQKNPVLIRKVCQSLAKIHSLEIPIKKYPEIIYSVDNIVREGYENNYFYKYIDEYKCETFKKYDLRTEVNWIKGVIKCLKSPILFTHNDFRSSNLMITEPNNELIVCDYDISGYEYRGNDFFVLMREWGHRKQIDFNSIEGLPLNDEFRPFIEVYVEECIRIHGKSYAENPINSVDHILKEAKVFLLYSFLWTTCLALKGMWQKDGLSQLFGIPNDPKIIMELTENLFKHYLTIKDLLKEKQLFD